MLDIVNPIHMVIWLTSLLGILISLFFIYKYNRKRGYIVGPLTYFINVFLYNLVLYSTFILGLNIFSLNQLQVWTDVVRLHSLFLFISFIIFQPVREKKLAGGEDGSP